MRAILRAADLRQIAAYMMATVGYGYINLNQIPAAIPPRNVPRDFRLTTS